MSKHFRENFLSAACGGWWICCPRRGYRASVTRHPSLSQTRTTSVRCVVIRYIGILLRTKGIREGVTKYVPIDPLKRTPLVISLMLFYKTDRAAGNFLRGVLKCSRNFLVISSKSRAPNFSANRF